MSDRFITPCPLPTAHERELLIILMEECAEVQQRASKLIRFGRDEVQPGQELPNSARLGEEIGDIICMVELLQAAEIVRDNDIETGRARKQRKLAKYLQTEPA